MNKLKGKKANEFLIRLNIYVYLGLQYMKNKNLI